MFEGAKVEAAESWCILRTAGRSTLKLAETLAEDGFEVWTPVETITKTVPRANVKRSVELPIMPGYVFARFGQALDLLRLARCLEEGRGTGPGRPNHHRFSVWISGRGAWSVAENDMIALREREAASRRQMAEAAKREAEAARRALSKQKAAPFKAGATVRLKDGEHGAFEGMVGRVLESDPGNTVILFVGYRRDVTIRTSLLDLNELEVTTSLVETAARDAA